MSIPPQPTKIPRPPRRTGRGGAGNFQSDLQLEFARPERNNPARVHEQVNSALPKHLHTMQSPSFPSPSAPLQSTNPSAPVLKSRGRGGAGNLLLSLAPSDSSTPEPSPVKGDRTPNTPLSPHRPAYAGRGGAGNWVNPEASSEIVEIELPDWVERGQELLEETGEELREPEQAIVREGREDVGLFEDR